MGTTRHLRPRGRLQSHAGAVDEALIGALVGGVVAAAIALSVARKWGLGLRRVAAALLVICGGAVLLVGLIADVLREPRFAAALASTGVTLLAATTVLAWRFYRDPDRSAPAHQDAILSPADGCVVYVKRCIAGQIPSSEKHRRTYVLHELA